VRLSTGVLVILGAIAALAAIAVTDRVLPAADPRTAELRPWIAARALGVTSYLLLGLEVALGLVLSHPRNAERWHRTPQVFPWHQLVTVFVGAFLVLHVALLAIDPYAQVGIAGALLPGFSTYRPLPVAIGVIALYALIVTAVTATWTRLLPAGWWLRIHRLAAVAFLLVWVHAVLAGTDGGALTPLYLATGIPVLAGIAHRWWSVRSRRRPTSVPSPVGGPTTADTLVTPGGPVPGPVLLEEYR
jgi:hypothetical protein